MLDKIRSVARLESGRLDAPYMPRYKQPYIKGGNVLLPDADTTVVEKVRFDVDCELIAVAVDTKKDEVLDSWEVFIGSENENLFEMVPFKKYAEGLYVMVAHRIPKETDIKFVFHNTSAKKKHVQYRFQFLMDGPAKLLPSEPEQPPVVEINHVVNPFCYEFIQDGKTIKVTGKVQDDVGVKNYSIYVNGNKEFRKDFHPPEKLDNFTYPIPVDIPPIPKPLVDVVFGFDTSASMGDDIANVKANLATFIKELTDKRIDLYLGAHNSNHNNPVRQPLVSSDVFNLNSINLDSGGWEGLAWKQFIDPEKGGAAFFPEFREGSKRFFIYLTDTYIKIGYTPEVAETFLAQGASVSVIHRSIHHDYDELVKATNGVNADLENPSFSDELNKITKKIIDDVVDDTQQEITFKVTATDELGLVGEKEITINMKYCEVEGL